MSYLSLMRSAAVLCALLFALQPFIAVAGTTPEQTWPIAAPQPERVAQGAPGSMRPGHIPLWPSGLEYTIDASFAWAMGNTGAPQGNGLPGGMDVIARWGFSPSSRLVIGYYDLQEYPAGFDVGTVPVYLQGVATPIGTQNLAATGLNAQV